ncbi:hypothetical protein [Thermocrinis minervae]|uniref:Uncharacterized protein n=1 Tax=Thermocrinis minervae TaxID=381751 RepID=A0A1M6T0G8_9AQUI|nr:hypothetical protein [Thermocrinis minervae]SHK50483.1 hypothetical protein SAMN05444391_1247 [Thermocrinis minervae]
MRVAFRIVLEEKGKRLTKEDLKDKKDPFHIGLRYITEFKYLEATKWLMLAPDSYEKYYLLYLLNLALGQEEQAKEFERIYQYYPKLYGDLSISTKHVSLDTTT